LAPSIRTSPIPSSLFWFAFNTGKKGITLNLETADGQEIFKRLARTADFVIESFPPGYMAGLGLGYFGPAVMATWRTTSLAAP